MKHSMPNSIFRNFISSKNYVRCFWLCVIAITSFLPLNAQQQKIDSLKKVIATSKSDTKVVASMVKLVWTFRRIDLDSAYEYAVKVVKLAEATNVTKYKAEAYDCMGMMHLKKGDFNSALELYKKYLETAVEIGDKSMQADAYHGVGNAYLYLGQYEPAMQSYLKGVKMNEQTGNKKWMANDYANIGVIQMRQKLYPDAIKTYNKVMGIYAEVKDSAGISTCLRNLGVCYSEQGDNKRALEYFMKTLAIKEREDIDEMAGLYNNIASSYMHLDQKDEALKYYMKARELLENSSNAYSKIYCFHGLGQIYLEKDPAKALNYFNDAIKISEESGLLYERMDGYGFLSRTYAKLGDYKQAHKYELMKSEIKDSVHLQQNNEAIIEMQTKFETEKKEQELELQSEKLKNQDTALENQKLINYFIIAGLVLVLIIVVIVVRNNKEKQKINALLETKNRDITDSINYALRIQQAILPSKELREQLFAESFLVFKPKDVVSGDFYWYGEKNGKKIIAAVDCTGHGVPGAFMSMIGYAFLNEIVNEKGITTPAEILSEMRNLVISTMKQKGLSGEAKDGMDIALISIDENKSTLEYSGANNPLWICRKGNKKEMEIIAADKRSVGYHLGRGLPFANHSIEINAGDTIYLFTDGYADQFGGPKGKKFKYKQLETLLLGISELPVVQQERELDKTFEEWKGNLEQVDDVCVLGIRIIS